MPNMRSLVDAQKHSISCAELPESLEFIELFKDSDIYKYLSKNFNLKYPIDFLKLDELDPVEDKTLKELYLINPNIDNYDINNLTETGLLELDKKRLQYLREIPVNICPETYKQLPTRLTELNFQLSNLTVESIKIYQDKIKEIEQQYYKHHFNFINSDLYQYIKSKLTPKDFLSDPEFAAKKHLYYKTITDNPNIDYLPANLTEEGQSLVLEQLTRQELIYYAKYHQVLSIDEHLACYYYTTNTGCWEINNQKRGRHDIPFIDFITSLLSRAIDIMAKTPVPGFKFKDIHRKNIRFIDIDGEILLNFIEDIHIKQHYTQTWFISTSCAEGGARAFESKVKLHAYTRGDLSGASLQEISNFNESEILYLDNSKFALDRPIKITTENNEKFLYHGKVDATDREVYDLITQNKNPSIIYLKVKLSDDPIQTQWIKCKKFTAEHKSFDPANPPIYQTQEQYAANINVIKHVNIHVNITCLHKTVSSIMAVRRCSLALIDRLRRKKSERETICTERLESETIGSLAPMVESEAETDCDMALIPTRKTASHPRAIPSTIPISPINPVRPIRPRAKSLIEPSLPAKEDDYTASIIGTKNLLALRRRSIAAMAREIRDDALPYLGL